MTSKYMFLVTEYKFQNPWNLGLGPVLDHLRTLDGMSLCAPEEEQRRYLSADNLRLFQIVDRLNGAVAGISALRYLDEYKYEDLFGNEVVLTNAVEFCCLVVLPKYRALGAARMMTEHRLKAVQPGRRAFMELRPSAECAFNTSVPAAAHASTTAIRKIAAGLGFATRGRQLADNSPVMVKV